MQVIVVIGRIAFILLIYLFLFRVLTALLADLQVKGLLKHPEKGVGRIEVVTGADLLPRGKTFRVEGKGLRVGRGKHNDIILSDHFASIEHAVFKLQQGELVIEDLGSTNGTFVNGERIHTSVDLVVGDYVKIGSIIFQVREVVK